MTEPESLVLREIRTTLDELSARFNQLTQTMDEILTRLSRIESLLARMVERGY